MDKQQSWDGLELKVFNVTEISWSLFLQTCKEFLSCTANLRMKKHKFCCFVYFIDLIMEKWQSWWKNLCWKNEWICDVYLNPGEPHAGFVKCLSHIQSISSIDFFNHFTGDTLYSLTQLPVENTVSLIKMLLLFYY